LPPFNPFGGSSCLFCFSLPCILPNFFCCTSIFPHIPSYVLIWSFRIGHFLGSCTSIAVFNLLPHANFSTHPFSFFSSSDIGVYEIFLKPLFCVAFRLWLLSRRDTETSIGLWLGDFVSGGPTNFFSLGCLFCRCGERRFNCGSPLLLVLIRQRNIISYPSPFASHSCPAFLSECVSSPIFRIFCFFRGVALWDPSRSVLCFCLCFFTPSLRTFRPYLTVCNQNHSPIVQHPSHPCLSPIFESTRLSRSPPSTYSCQYFAYSLW